MTNLDEARWQILLGMMTILAVRYPVENFANPRRVWR